MKTHRIGLAAGLAAALVVGGWMASRAVAQTATKAGDKQATAEQQKQLDQLQQLEGQLEKDRTAVHAAIAEHGWDSDEVDAAREQLIRDRTQYRQLRRSLVASGIAVPAPKGMGAGPGPMGGPGPMAGRGQGGPRGRSMRHGACCDSCPCCGM